MRTIEARAEDRLLESFETLCAHRHMKSADMIRMLVTQYVVDHLSLLPGGASEPGKEDTQEPPPAVGERPAREIRQMYERVSELKEKMPQPIWVLLSAVEMHLREALRALGTLP